MNTPVMETSIPSQNLDSILNRSNPATSIYQKSINLLDKLACIDGFDVYISAMFEDSARDMKSGGGSSSSAPYLNPIQLLWDTFRQGTSLCVIYNALQPKVPLDTSLDESGNILRQRKERVYHFVRACKEDHIVKDEDLFTITELFKDDTNSFVKVLKTIEIVVDTVQSRGLLNSDGLVERPSARFAEAQLGPPQDNRERVVKEFVETERRYVQDLEQLQAYMDELQRKNIISSDSIRYIFANLNSIVDFQRRFLVGMEPYVPKPPEEQHFGELFISMKEGFMVYEPYCANYARAAKLCLAERDSLNTLSHIIDPHYELPSMLIKPVQRICKYPMILEELSKFYDKSSPIYAELREGISAVNSIVVQVNEAERKESNIAVVSELEERVEDWKGYLITTFGELHLHGTFVMSTTGVERELLIYLFENILICCKEVSEKDKKRSQKHKPNALQLKGRIFLFSIHSVVDTSRDGQFSLTIYWRDVVMENFSLACKSEEQLKQWKDTMERLIARTNERAPSANQTPGSGSSQGHQGAGNEYDSDEDISNVRRGRFSEGSSLTAAMQQEKSQSSLTYRKTYDGGASRSRNNAKKLASDYQSELADGIERSATISTFHRRQGTNGSSSSFGEPGDSLHRSRTSPMPSGYYNGQDGIPPVPVPPLNRADGDTLGRMHPPRAPGTIAINSPIPTAFTSSISPMTPSLNGMVPGGQLSAMSSVTTPVPSIASTQSISNHQPTSPAKAVKVKVHFHNDIYVVIARQDMQFKELIDRVDRKIKICAGPHVGITSGLEHDILSAPPLNIRMRYQDEDGDMINIGSNEDVQMAFESANVAKLDENAIGTLNIFVAIQ
ncbi:Guanine nucleotide exchange factor for Cdc42p [Coemansia erecta]|uniref:Guanine nucleotide exchange factor for Cdc42p n=1 Tax=Coemansia erecta TaxID=147472 RepID=A0A9W8CPH6_9FUNG|nr:Guanine nucleotide exchange factor for Cdc42p [Coemansia erecta]